MANTRKTVYNSITSDEKMALVNPENISLGDDFIEYLTSVDRAKSTIESYKADLKIIWVLVHDLAGNKFFVELSKRDIVKIQNHCLNVFGWSPARMRRIKSTMSSLSNYIENMLDDEYDFRPIVRKIENPASAPVREKTVLTEEQIQTLLDAMVEKGRYDIACMLALGVYSGRRKSELTRMKVSYFTDENVIYGSLYKTPEKVKTKGRGSRGKLLNVYVLKKQFQPYLDLWMKYREENDITSEWLIPKKENGIWLDEPVPTTTLDSWADIFTRILGIPVYWHSMRHRFATALSEASIPDSVIQDIVGWESADMCRLYIDTDVDTKFEKYFGEDGIKQVEQKSLADM